MLFELQLLPPLFALLSKSKTSQKQKHAQPPNLPEKGIKEKHIMLLHLHKCFFV